ncbi:MAG: TIGR03905 family TSCPD domain-containing protein [Elusimicrobiota bacterium]|jgi:uncharacterized protein (TIGR03905 family)
MKTTFRPRGTSSTLIAIEVEGGVLKKAAFTDGCSGNTQGVAALAAGRPVQEVIKRLKGIRCGDKDTSCPDQLARALEGLA